MVLQSLLKNSHNFWREAVPLINCSTIHGDSQSSTSGLSQSCFFKRQPDFPVKCLYITYTICLSVCRSVCVSKCPKEKMFEKDLKVVATETISLSCEVAQAKTEVKWFKDGKLITSSKKFKVEAEGRSRRLIIQQVEKKDGGEYTCEAGKQKLTYKVVVEGENNNFAPYRMSQYHKVCSTRKAESSCGLRVLFGHSGDNLWVLFGHS
uniref:Ig-like domain-containing protein n=1 Tax=Pseudonaja textilis TaxID=8673 RepID=A0A670YPS7_PSETE